MAGREFGYMVGVEEGGGMVMEMVVGVIVIVITGGRRINGEATGGWKRRVRCGTRYFLFFRPRGHMSRNEGCVAVRNVGVIR